MKFLFGYKFNLLFISGLFLTLTSCTKLPPEEFRNLIFYKKPNTNVCFRISDIINYLSYEEKFKGSWEKESDVKWIYRVEGFDKMTEKQIVLKYRFVKKDKDAVIDSIVLDGKVIEGIDLVAAEMTLLPQLTKSIGTTMWNQKAPPPKCSK